ncbi:MAG: glucose-6-phosphate isomerase, partial [Candidatus Azotimanducaceae bacterium]
MSIKLTPAWKALEAHAQIVKDSSIASYFSQEQDRATSRIISTCGLTLDYSKSRADAKTFEL